MTDAIHSSPACAETHASAYYCCGSYFTPPVSLNIIVARRGRTRLPDRLLRCIDPLGQRGATFLPSVSYRTKGMQSGYQGPSPRSSYGPEPRRAGQRCVAPVRELAPSAEMPTGPTLYAASRFSLSSPQRSRPLSEGWANRYSSTASRPTIALIASSQASILCWYSRISLLIWAICSCDFKRNAFNEVSELSPRYESGRSIGTDTPLWRGPQTYTPALAAGQLAR